MGEISLEVLVVLPLIMFCQLACSYLESRFPQLMLHLPEVGVVILIGMFTGWLISTNPDSSLESLESFSPPLFFIGLLPPIIFNSGFHLKRSLFFCNVTPILSFAVAGTIASAALIGVGMWLLTEYANPLSSIENPLTLAECLTFGALISATDPVSTLVLFAELRVEPHLFYLVFGESVMNDAVGIVLFNTAKRFITGRGDSSTVYKACGAFVANLLGSAAVGVLLPVLMAAIIRHSRIGHNPTLEQGLVVLFVWVPYLVGESMELSGIVATLGAGMASRKFIAPNLTAGSEEAVIATLRMVSGFMETAAFLALGLGCVLHNRESYDAGMIFWAIALCCLSRPVVTYSLSWLLNRETACCNDIVPRRIDAKTQHMLSFAGLRGVVAFACVVQWPEDPTHDDDDDDNNADDEDGARAHHNLFKATTTSVILFTVFVQGGLTYSVLEWLGIETGCDESLFHAPGKPHFVRCAIGLVDRFVSPFAFGFLPCDRLRRFRTRLRSSDDSQHSSIAPHGRVTGDQQQQGGRATSVAGGEGSADERGRGGYYSRSRDQHPSRLDEDEELLIGKDLSMGDDIIGGALLSSSGKGRSRNRRRGDSSSSSSSSSSSNNGIGNGAGGDSRHHLGDGLLDGVAKDAEAPVVAPFFGGGRQESGDRSMIHRYRPPAATAAASATTAATTTTASANSGAGNAGSEPASSSSSSSSSVLPEPLSTVGSPSAESSASAGSVTWASTLEAPPSGSSLQHRSASTGNSNRHSHGQTYHDGGNDYYDGDEVGDGEGLMRPRRSFSTPHASSSSSSSSSSSNSGPSPSAGRAGSAGGGAATLVGSSSDGLPRRSPHSHGGDYGYGDGYGYGHGHGHSQQQQRQQQQYGYGRNQNRPFPSQDRYFYRNHLTGGRREERSASLYDFAGPRRALSSGPKPFTTSTEGGAPRSPTSLSAYFRQLSSGGASAGAAAAAAAAAVGGASSLYRASRAQSVPAAASAPAQEAAEAIGNRTRRSSAGLQQQPPPPPPLGVPEEEEEEEEEEEQQQQQTYCPPQPPPEPVVLRTAGNGNNNGTTGAAGTSTPGTGLRDI